MLQHMSELPFLLRLNNNIHIHKHFVIHLSVDGHLGCFQLLSTVNSAAPNMKISIFSSFGYISWSGIAGLYGNSICTLLRNTLTLNKLKLHIGK